MASGLVKSRSKLENCEVKQKWDISVYLLEWPKSKALTVSNAGEAVEPQELSFIAGGMQSGPAIVEDSMAVSYKAKHTLPVSCVSHAPFGTYQMNRKLTPHKILLVDAYSSCIRNCQNLVVTGVSLSRWMDKETVVHPALKTNELSSRKRHGGKLLHGKEAHLKRLHTVWHSRKGKTIELVKRSAVARD